MAIEHDAPEPPPKVYGFKERDFKRDNSLTSPAPPTAKEHAINAGPTPFVMARIPGGSKVGGVDRSADPNDVYAVLQQNRAIEKKAGLNEVQIREIKYRRKRDYWLTLIGGNIFIVGAVYIIGFNVFTLVYGLAGVVMFSLGLTWIMWQIMSKY